jgi:hypothetical protein
MEPFDDSVVPPPDTYSQGGLLRVKARRDKETEARDTLYSKVYDLFHAFYTQSRKAAAAEFEVKVYETGLAKQDQDKKITQVDRWEQRQKEKQRKLDEKAAEIQKQKDKASQLVVYHKRKLDSKDDEPADSEDLDDTKEADEQDLRGPPRKRQRHTKPRPPPQQQSQPSTASDRKETKSSSKLGQRVVVMPLDDVDTPMTPELIAAQNKAREAWYGVTYHTFKALGWPVPPEPMPEEILKNMHPEDRQDHKDLWAFYDKMQSELLAAKAEKMNMRQD